MINKKLVGTPVKMMNRMEEITDLICEYNDEVQKQQEENTRLQQRIDKAMEYIEDNSDDMHTYISQAITQILKGSDKE